jgi:mono/diheme cytochrome c family protein
MKIRPRAILGTGAALAAAFVWLGLAAGTDAQDATNNGAPVRFNRDVRPILSENCLACHGPDPGTRKAGMRLDIEEGLFGPRKKGGFAVVKGDLKNSLMYQRITTDDEDDVMPPPKSHKKLTLAQKETIRRWIEQGAPYEQHWSFITPVRPQLPAVKDVGWVRNPIDAFILARLEKAGLKPAPEADRRALFRRAAFDLTGLPPSSEDVEAFVNDPSTDAYEKAVDRLLASPAYGEHRARYWLDAVRYADTHGLHFDNYREMWPYRDWVINAFNQNMPFDRFTVEQLAGDLLPKRTLEQQIASGYNRCNLTTNEGGTIPEENLVFYTRDRTETAGRIWLGLTVNCAVCHDHKFDAITQRDFYSLSAFFNNSTVGALDGNVKDSAPVAVVPSAEDRPKLEKVSTELGGIQKRLQERRTAVKPDYDKWLASATADGLRATLPLKDLKLHAPLDEGKDQSVRLAVDGQIRDVPLIAGAKWQPGHVAAKSLQAGQAGAIEIADAGDFDKNQPFTAATWAKLPSRASGAIVARMGAGGEYRGWDLFVQGDRLTSHIIHHWDKNDAIKVVSEKPFDVAKWHHFAVTYDGSAKAAGVKLYVDGELQPVKVERDGLKGTTRAPVPLKVGQRDKSEPLKNVMTQDLRLYARALSADELKNLATAPRLATIVAKPADKRSDAERNELFDWWLASNDQPTRELNVKRDSLEAEQNVIKARSPVTLVMEDRPEPAKAYILFRGEYDKRRDEVAADTPKSMPPFPKDAPRNRLGLAQWLLRPENPFTARVTVNRFWQEIFGTGLVKTTEDLGIMGEMPSHPELLDWLAVEFRESGWDVKRLFKLIVTSSAYRQAAVLTPEKLEKDPENRLISRGPRFRLEAEALRDEALAASGLLVRKIGGPSVKPYQPPGVWEAVAMPESNTKSYKPDADEGLYRRSVYTFWKRAAPPASMEILNAPSREVCTVRRERTDTPLQALVTLNDPQFFEAARVLAQKALQTGGPTFESRLNWMSQRLIARPMRSEEIGVARGALNDLLAYYKSNVEDAKKLLSVGESKRDEKLDPAEHAAWTMLANQLMNLDEVLNK